MSHQHATLEDTVYLWFGANDTSGSGGDGASPVYDVRLAGAASDAAPVLSGSATLLSHANYPSGAHEVAVAATAANGFAATNTYAVFCTLLVDSQNPTGFVGSFTLAPIIASVTTVTGNVNGKVLGGGAGSITGVGVYAQDFEGEDLQSDSSASTRYDLLQTDLDTITDDGVTLADGVTHGGSTALLSLKTVTVAATGADVDAVTITSAAGHDFAFTANKDVIHVTSCVDFIEIDACEQILAAASCTGVAIQVTTTGTYAAHYQSTHASGAGIKASGNAGMVLSGDGGGGLNVDDSISGTAIVLASSTAYDIDGTLRYVTDLPTDADVLAQVNAALDTAISELGVAAPTATPTLRTGLMLLYMALRNKLVVQTSGTDAIEIYNNAGTKIASKAISDDGLDYTEDEMA